MNDDYPPDSPPWYPGPEPTPNEFRREMECEPLPYANAGCTDPKCSFTDYLTRDEWEYARRNGIRCNECGRPMRISAVFQPGERLIEPKESEAKNGN